MPGNSVLAASSSLLFPALPATHVSLKTHAEYQTNRLWLGLESWAGFSRLYALYYCDSHLEPDGLHLRSPLSEAGRRNHYR